MIEETRYKETMTDVDRSRMPMGAATYPHEDYRPSFMLSRIIAWGPIWGGVVIAVGVQALLTVLGMAVGLTVMDATRDTAGGAPEGSGVVAGIWWVISSLIALFLGGWATGFFAGPRKPAHGAINGFVLWCVITALSAALLTMTSGALIGGGLGALGNVAANRTAANTSPTIVGEEGTRDFTRTATTDRIAEGSASVAWWTFVVMALSAGAAVLGGAMGPRSGEMQRRLV